ncbi:tetratricopeptide repeat protein [Peribacillus sp. B-H-3]|uniref:tetratricopeptide repeat protein n=1 Tax=Peribacillus sp. B-H-3 TaxID=3400420 RepID=UPI003B020529
MKKAGLLLVSLALLTGCTSKVYSSNMELGKDQLKDGHYQEASEAFSKAFKDNRTNEAKELMKASKYMEEGTKAFNEGDFKVSVSFFKKVLDMKAEQQEDKDLKKEAKDWMEKGVLADKQSTELKAQLSDGLTALNQKKFDEASKQFQEVAEKSADPALKEEANALIKQTTDQKQAYSKTASSQPSKDTNDSVKEQAGSKEEEQKQPAAEVPKKKENPAPKQNEPKPSAGKKNDDKHSQTAKSLTHSEAEKLVKSFLHMENSSNIKAHYDHDADNGDYIIHVFEVVIDDPKTKEGHTATWGWYGVNPKTKKVYEAI